VYKRQQYSAWEFKLAIGKNVEHLEDKLLKVIPAEFKVDAHH
jgi:endonuclease-3